MEDYGKFLEMVNEIKNIAVTQGGKLTKEEILSYLGDMQLSEEQLQALYQSLCRKQTKCCILQPAVQE